jgi:hypothetical protein
MCRKLAKNQTDKAQKEKALELLQDRLMASCGRLQAAEKALKELEEARPDSIQASSSPQPLCTSHHASCSTLSESCSMHPGQQQIVASH